MPDSFNPYLAQAPQSTPQTASGAYNPYMGDMTPPPPQANFNPYMTATQTGVPQDIPMAAKISDAMNRTNLAQMLSKTSGSPTEVAAQLGAAHGLLQSARNVYLLARDVTDKMGVSNPQVTSQIRDNYNSEAEQLKNLPQVQDAPTAYKIADSIATQAAPMAAGAMIPGGGGVLAKILSSAAAGGVAGGMQDPGNVDDPLKSRALSAGLGAVAGGVVGSVMPVAQRLLAGPATAENIASQQALGALGNKFNVPLTVPQITGRAGGTETLLAKVPFVGGKQGLLDQRTALTTADQDFMNSLRTPAQQVTDAWSNTLDKIGQAVPQVPLNNAKQAATDIAQSYIKNGLDPHPAVQQWIDNIRNRDTMPIDALKELREELDATTSTAVKSNATGNAGFTGKDVTRLATMRSAMESDIGAAADQAGQSDAYAAAKQMTKNNMAYDHVQQLWNSSLSAAGNLQPGKFGVLLRKQADDIGSLLTPDSKQALGGLIKLHEVTSTIMNQAKDQTSVVGALAGAGGAAALHNPILIGGVGSVMKAASYLLNSDAGRNMLTYMNRLSPQGAVAKDIAGRLIQTVSASAAANTLNPAPQFGGQPAPVPTANAGNVTAPNQTPATQEEE